MISTLQTLQAADHRGVFAQTVTPGILAFTCPEYVGAQVFLLVCFLPHSLPQSFVLCADLGVLLLPGLQLGHELLQFCLAIS
jgi:hypothetical protein